MLKFAAYDKWNDVLECKCSTHCNVDAETTAFLSFIYLVDMIMCVSVLCAYPICMLFRMTRSTMSLWSFYIWVYPFTWYYMIQKDDNNHSIHNFQCKSIWTQQQQQHQQITAIQQLNNSTSHKMANILRDHGSSLLKCMIKKASTHSHVYAYPYIYIVTVWNAHSFARTLY